MNLRQKLLLLLSLTVALAVAAVAWTVLVRIRQVFEQRDQQETALFVSQFQREFQHRSAEVAAAVERMAASERVRAMAFELAQSGDASPYVTEAQTLAQDAQLDFLEIIVAPTEISSVPRSGRRALVTRACRKRRPPTFLKSRRTARRQRTALGLFAVRAVRRADCQLSLDSKFASWRQAPRPNLSGRSARRAGNAGLSLYSDAILAQAVIGAPAAPAAAFDPARLVGADRRSRRARPVTNP
jgi:two-component system, NtrC family, nitrogen regulation sensor histidine kinase NtrY